MGKWVRDSTAWLFRALMSFRRGAEQFRSVIVPLRETLKASHSADVPEPSVELTLLALHGRALLASMSPKQRRRYFKALGRSMATFEDVTTVVRIRGRAHDEALMVTRLAAVAWTRATLASFAAMDALGK